MRHEALLRSGSSSNVWLEQPQGPCTHSTLFLVSMHPAHSLSSSNVLSLQRSETDAEVAQELSQLRFLCHRMFLCSNSRVQGECNICPWLTAGILPDFRPETAQKRNFQNKCCYLKNAGAGGWGRNNHNRDKDLTAEQALAEAGLGQGSPGARAEGPAGEAAAQSGCSAVYVCPGLLRVPLPRTSSARHPSNQVALL